jgi:hypothetical protein
MKLATRALIGLLVISGLGLAAVFMTGKLRQTANTPALPPTLPLAPSATTSAPAQGDVSAKYGTFDFVDTREPISARVYLPLSMGQWAIENPWRDAATSLTKAPKVYVTAMFQSVASRNFNGILRVIDNLEGYDCAVVFSELDHLNGLKLVKYSDSSVAGVSGGKVYVFELQDAQGANVVGEKLLCDTHSAIEIFVTAPNDPIYTASLNEVLKMVTLRIPGMENE